MAANHALPICTPILKNLIIYCIPMAEDVCIFRICYIILNCRWCIIMDLLVLRLSINILPCNLIISEGRFVQHVIQYLILMWMTHYMDTKCCYICYFYVLNFHFLCNTLFYSNNQWDLEFYCIFTWKKCMTL